MDIRAQHRGRHHWPALAIVAMVALWASVSVAMAQPSESLDPDAKTENLAPPVRLSVVVDPGVVLARRPVVAVATLTADKPTTVCLMADPNVQFELLLTNAHGKAVPSRPVVATLPDAETVSPFRTEGVFHRLMPLKAGQSMALRLNVSRHIGWNTLPVGEYQIKSTFNLCNPAIFEKHPIDQRTALSDYPVESVAVTDTAVARFYQSD